MKFANKEDDKSTIVQDLGIDRSNIFLFPTVTSCSSSVIIGDNCWLCMGGTILKGAKLGDYCILGAESLLVSDLGKEKYVVAAGHPAKIIKRGVYLNVFDCSPEWHY